jgi:hypothetical protein
MPEEVIDTIEAHDKNENKTLPVVKRFESGYAIAQDATLTDGGTFLKNESYCLINPSGKILLNDNDVETLEEIVNNPVQLERVEKTGSIAKH